MDNGGEVAFNSISLSLAGLYLYMLVVETFSGDNMRFNTYAGIGWGELASNRIPYLVFKSFRHKVQKPTTRPVTWNSLGNRITQQSEGGSINYR